MGQDPKCVLHEVDTNGFRYTGQRFRRSIALFWSSIWAEKSFQKQLKESRKVEEVILAFVSASTKALKKESDLADGGWKAELNAQILLFLDLLGDNLASVGSVGGELRSRLSTYRARLEADIQPSQHPQPKAEDSPAVNPPTQTHDNSLKPTEVVRRILRIDPSRFEERLSSLRGVCSVDAAVVDLKASLLSRPADVQVLLQKLSTDTPLPYGPADFDSDVEWSAYRSREISALTELTVDMMKLEANRERGPDRPDKVDLVQSLEGLKLEDRTLTFVPPDPRDAYRQLLRTLLNYDLEILRTLPEDQDVSLGILSAEHVVFLAECALRWRIPPSFSTWVFLDAIQDHYEQGEVPPDCVFEATGEVGRVTQEQPVSSWSILDRNGLQAVLVRRNIFFLNDIEIALASHDGYLSEEFAQAVDHWYHLDAEEDDHPSFQRTQRAICDRLRQQAYANYIDEASERYSYEGGKNQHFAVALAAWIESGAKKVDKLFPQPVTT